MAHLRSWWSFLILPLLPVLCQPSLDFWAAGSMWMDDWSRLSKVFTNVDVSIVYVKVVCFLCSHYFCLDVHIWSCFGLSLTLSSEPISNYCNFLTINIIPLGKVLWAKEVAGPGMCLHNWVALKEVGVPQRSIVLTYNLYHRQEATVRTECGETEWFPTGKGVRQGCILSPYLVTCKCRTFTENWATLRGRRSENW